MSTHSEYVNASMIARIIPYTERQIISLAEKGLIAGATRLGRGTGRMSRKESNLYKRGDYWWVKIERQGRKIHESTGETTLKAAREYRELALEKLKKLRNGLRDNITYEKTMDEFLDHCSITIKPSSVKRYIVSALAMENHFTGKNLGDITKGDIATYLSDRKVNHLIRHIIVTGGIMLTFIMKE